MDTINTILPNISQPEFMKMIESLGIKTYKSPGPNHLVLYFPGSDRGLRKSILMELNKMLPGTTYKDDGRSGMLVTGMKAKIFLKPLKTSGGITLKPALFGSGSSKIVDRDIHMKDYYLAVMVAIEQTKELTEEQKEILKSIVKYTNRLIPQREMAGMLAALSDAISINTISNDFGEVLGPLGINTNKLLPIDFTTAKIFIPKAGNYPLLDYIIRDAQREYKISAKSGDTTNTLKPGDVKAIIDGIPLLYNKYKNSEVYGVIDILSKSSWKEGPINAAKYLSKRNYKECAWAVDSVAYTEPFRQQAENDIVKISKESLDFTDIFMDAILSNEVYYVKYALNMNGDQSWKLVRSERVPGKAQKRIFMRSKNFVGRPNGDKLGFQPN